MKKRRKFEAGYLTSMLDLLSGAFACAVLLFVIFAALRNSNSSSEAMTFLFVEGYAESAHPDLEDWLSLEIAVIPMLESLPSPDREDVGAMYFRGFSRPYRTSSQFTDLQAEGVSVEPIWPVAGGIQGIRNQDQVGTTAILGRIHGEYLIHLKIIPRKLALVPPPESNLTFSLDLLYSREQRIFRTRQKITVEFTEFQENILNNPPPYPPALRYQKANPTPGYFLGDPPLDPVQRSEFPEQSEHPLTIILTSVAEVSP